MKLLVRNALFLLLSALVFTDVFAQAQPYSGHHGMMGGWGWGGMIIGPIMMLVFLGAAVAVVVFVIRWIGGSQPGPLSPRPSSKEALDILNVRYAQGEIDTEEFEMRKRALSE